MEVERVESAEVGWMKGLPRYRVYFWPGDNDRESTDGDKWDVRDADVIEALHWAEENAGEGGTYTIYAVVPRRGDRGLVYLAGDRTKERPSAAEDKKSVARKIYEAVKLPVAEQEPYGNRDQIEKRLKGKTAVDAVASAILAEAENVDEEPRRRRDGAERRATTLQGGVAIAATFGIAIASLLVDKDKISAGFWRDSIAISSFLFVGCLVVSGFRAVGALGRTHMWEFPKRKQIYERVQMTAAEAKLDRAVELLATFSRNNAISHTEVGYLRQAAQWFFAALLFLLADAALLLVYSVTR